MGQMKGDLVSIGVEKDSISDYAYFWGNAIDELRIWSDTKTIDELLDYYETPPESSLSDLEYYL
eukprot:CAMPEP_0201281958 /NCGR_PEP_ID=MMETSP1317-20130820/4534_1 /ASSEMBLY_ACC=CAM_ASM_000770 /TAXON_ID=187299 /ORGANISM="Undescribed Undescribed, Strain Undescribed" /LENGTH=63 /DNA_ID=CAMNT_0047593395 /DNA_START=1 /DNA_END=192 /DNA_ORIENTATION=-